MQNFNEPTFLGNELEYISNAINRHKISGDGFYTKECNKIIENETQTDKALLTTSCTAALEMAALILNLQPGDEVICPSYTFVTTVSSFVLRGAKPVFIDIRSDTLNIDENLIEAAITPKTKAIFPVHYAGVSCNMDKILQIAAKHNLFVVEDAAQAVGSFYKGKACGSMGDMGCFSFHETKNIVCGEGGALLINKPQYIETAEIIREKGTNRSKFFRGQVDKYTWVGLGSSYLPSELNAAYLYPQLQHMTEINAQRMKIWETYHEALAPFEKSGHIRRPIIPQDCTHNAHMYYLLFNNLETRTAFIEYMKSKNILCVFHYIPLHSSPYGQQCGRIGSTMETTDRISDTLVRLPLYYGLSEEKQAYIIQQIKDFIS